MKQERVQIVLKPSTVRQCFNTIGTAIVLSIAIVGCVFGIMAYVRYNTLSDEVDEVVGHVITMPGNYTSAKSLALRDGGMHSRDVGNCPLTAPPTLAQVSANCYYRNGDLFRMDHLADVIYPLGPTDGQVMKYDEGMQRWTAETLLDIGVPWDVNEPSDSVSSVVILGPSGNALETAPISIDPSTGHVDGRDIAQDGTTLDAHVNSVSNPHSVTKQQIGLNRAVLSYLPTTDCAMPKFDGINGLTIRQSGVVLDNVNNMRGAASVAVNGVLEPGYRVSIKGNSGQNGIFIATGNTASDIPLHIQNVEGTQQLLHLTQTGLLGLNTITPQYSVDDHKGNGINTIDTYYINGEQIQTVDLADVCNSPASTNQVLAWNGVQWCPADDLDVTGLASLTDVAIANVTENEILTYIGGQWINTLQQNINTLAGLLDVCNDLSPELHQVLHYNGTCWGALDDVDATALTHLGDVDLLTTPPQDCQVLGYDANAAMWRPQPAILSPSGVNNNEIVRFDGGTGKMVQGSSVFVDDIGNIILSGQVDGVDVSDLNARVISHENNLNNPHMVTANQLGLSNVENILNNYNASSPPSSQDDSVEGYQKGSLWIDCITGTTYALVDDSAGAAIWVITSEKGNVRGPPSSHVSSIAIWQNNMGMQITDSLAEVTATGSIIVPIGQLIDGRDVSVDHATYDSHLSNTNNPHMVTAAQIGLQDAVLGPVNGMSTNHGLAVWDGTTGRLVRDSGVTLSTSNDLIGLHSVAIGAPPSPGFKLTIGGNDNGIDIRTGDAVGETPLRVSNHAGTAQHFIVDNHGHVGIGTFSPQYDIDAQHEHGINSKHNYFVNGQPIALEHMNDVDLITLTPNVGELLRWDGTHWVPSPDVDRLDQLQDVDVTTVAPTDRQVLGYNATLGLWVPFTDKDITSISGLADVDTETGPPSVGHVLAWDGSNWSPASNQPPTGIDSLTDVSTSGTNAPTGGQVLSWDPNINMWIPRSDADITGLDGLSDVDLSGANAPADGQSLRYDGNHQQWTPQTDVDVQYLHELLDVDVDTVIPQAGNVISWNGTAWRTCQALRTWDMEMVQQHAVPRYSDTSGKWIEDTTVFIDNGGNILLGGLVDGVDVSDLKNTVDNHIGDTANPHMITKTQVGLGLVPNLKQNLVENGPPATNNDNTENYSVGSFWYDVTNDKMYVCLDSSTNAAVWLETTNQGNNGDVIGPSTSQNNEIVLFDGASGVLIKGSNVFINGGNIELTGTVDGIDVSIFYGLFNTHAADFNNPHMVTKAQVGLSNVQNILHCFTCMTNPGPTNDNTDGYQKGSNWINCNTGEQYVLVDDTTGAAVWHLTTVGGNVVGPISGSQDNEVPRYDGTTGLLIQGSNVFIDDNGNIVLTGTVDGVDISVLKTTVDTHVSDFKNPHMVTAAQLGLQDAVIRSGTSANNQLARWDGTGKVIQSSMAELSDAGELTGLTLLAVGGVPQPLFVHTVKGSNVQQGLFIDVGGSTGNEQVLQARSNSGTELLSLLANGRLGLGTTSASYSLDDQHGDGINTVDKYYINGSPLVINHLDNVQGSPVNGQVLTYNVSAGSWGPQSVAAVSLGGLSDVDLVTAPPTAGQLLSFDGTNWVPVSDVDITGLDGLSDVSVAGGNIPMDGQVLTYDNADGLWKPSAAAPGSLIGLFDTDLTTVTPTTSDSLVYDGTKWVPDKRAQCASGSVTHMSIALFDGTSGCTFKDSLVTVTGGGSIILPVGETVDGVDISALDTTVTNHIGNFNNPHNTDKSDVGLGNVENILNCYTCTSNPNANDDQVDGYSVGSFWHNVVTDQSFVALDVNNGAAIWKLVTGDGDVSSSVSSSQDNAIARFDGTSGKIIQDSPVFITDTGDIVLSGHVDGVDVSDLKVVVDTHVNDLNNPHQTSLSGLSDTQITSPTVGDVLEWDGNKWTAATPSGGGGGEFGSRYYYAECENVATISSSTYTTKCTLSTGSIPSGTYRFGWSAECASSSGRDCDILVKRGSSTLSEVSIPKQSCSSSSGGCEYISAGAIKHDTFFGSTSETYTVSVRKGKSGGSTVYVRSIRMEFWKVV